jgi:hypothetical protein
MTRLFFPWLLVLIGGAQGTHAASSGGHQATLPLVIVSQDTAGLGTLQQLDGATGSVQSPADPLSFVFPWPLVEMTADRVNKAVYLVTFPENATAPALYKTDQRLRVVGSWLNSSFSFFDLQYAPRQECLYGIKVTGQRQRTLSRFLVKDGADVDATELYDLPVNWYVNASSFDTQHDVYYAIVNHFPNMPDSTDKQLLAVGDFSSCGGRAAVPCKNPPVSLQTISGLSGTRVQFVVFSEATGGVLVAGINNETSTAVVTLIDPATGALGKPLFEAHGVGDIGPLVLHPDGGRQGEAVTLTFFTQPAAAAGGEWVVWELQFVAVGGGAIKAHPRARLAEPAFRRIAAGVAF